MSPLAVPSGQPRFDHRCARCGYGIRVSELPPSCPMCGGADWEDGLGRRATTAGHRTRQVADANGPLGRNGGGGDGRRMPGPRG